MSPPAAETWPFLCPGDLLAFDDGSAGNLVSVPFEVEDLARAGTPARDHLVCCFVEPGVSEIDPFAFFFSEGLVGDVGDGYCWILHDVLVRVG